MSLSQPRIARTIVKSRGWAGLASGLKMDLRHQDFLARQRSILEAIDMTDLLGIDAELVPVLEGLPEGTSWRAGRKMLRNHLFLMIRKQVGSHRGSTMFFDIDEMMKTEAAILVPDILRRRREEVHETVLLTDGKTIRTVPLHLTFYGHKIMTSLSIFSSLLNQRLQELTNALESLDLSIGISDEEEFVAVIVSEEMKKHIFHGQLSLYLLNYIRQQYYEWRYPVSISDIFTEFRALGFDRSEITLQISEEVTKGNLLEEKGATYRPNIKVQD